MNYLYNTTIHLVLHAQLVTVFLGGNTIHDAVQSVPVRCIFFQTQRNCLAKRPQFGLSVRRKTFHFFCVCFLDTTSSSSYTGIARHDLIQFTIHHILNRHYFGGVTSC